MDKKNWQEKRLGESKVNQPSNLQWPVLKNVHSNTGDQKHVVKFVKMQKRIANYIQKKYNKRGSDIATAVENLIMPTLGMPTKPDK